MSIKTYRHQITGLVGQFPEELAEIFPDLVEVADDAKPLAYTPIPADAVADLQAAQTPATNPEGSAQ
jgi:hypothetical protein